VSTLRTRLYRTDTNDAGDLGTWGMKALFFFCHKLKTGVTLRRSDWTIIELDRVVSKQEFINAMSEEKFVALGCVIEFF
jgi:hypothetical protein